MDNVKILEHIRASFHNESIVYSRHARTEMRVEEFGVITDEEVYEAIQNGETIEDYPNDKPYPSVLVYGKTKLQRPIHVVVAYSLNESVTIIVTVYHPHPDLWIDYRKRKI